MAFDQKAVEAKYGIASQAAPLNRSNVTTLGSGKPSSGFSVKGLAHSVAAIPSAAAHFVASSFPNVARLGTAISQGLPIVGSIAQNQRFHDQQMKGIDAAEKSYTQQFKQGKISKDRYRQLVTDLSKDRSQISATLTNQAKQYVAPSDFVKDLVGTAALPLAAGRLTTAGKLGGLAAKAGGVATSRGVASAAAAMPVKQALIYGPTAQSAEQVAQGKNVPENLALAAGAVAAPGIVKAAGKIGGAVKNAFFDSSGLFDHVNLAGGKTVNQAVKDAEQLVASGKMSQSKYKTIVDNLKVSQDQNLANHGTAYKAAKMITQTQAAAGRPTEGLSLEQFAREQGKLAGAARKTEALAGGGKLFDAKGNAVSQEMASRLTVGKASITDKAQIASRFAQDAKEGNALKNYAQIRQDFPEFFKNKNNASAIEKIVSESKDPAEIKARINSEITGTSELFTKNAAGELVPASHAGGYHSIISENPVPSFRTPSEVAKIDTGNKAMFGSVGNFVRKTGFSPEPTDREALNDALKQNFNKEIDKVPELAGKADTIYAALGKMLRQGVTGANERSLLTKREIMQGLEGAGIGPNFAGPVRKALDQAHLKIPAELRGAGGKVTDILTAKLPGERQLLRAQQIGRFGALNIFFQGKVALKSEALAQAYSGGHIGPRVPAEVDQYIKDSGLGRLFTSNFTDFIGDVPNVNRGRIGDIQQNIAGRMVTQMLKNHDTSVTDLGKNPALKHEIDHAIETVFGYPKGGFLDSNFAKAMNVVVFPFRFETKVLGAMGHFLLKSDPVTRLALTTGMVHANEWIKSPEGQRWQHQNSELATIAKYFSPVETVGHLIEGLSGKPVKLTDFGLLGGLPLGFISTILEGQGVNLGPFDSSGFRDPKTGELVPKKVPADDATRIKKGITDLINSMYSYPGRQLGLSSKSDVVQTAIPALKGGKYNYVGGEQKPNTPSSKSNNVPTGNVLRTPTLPDSVRAAATAAGTPKPKKARVGRVKHKAVAPGTPF